MNFSLHEGDYLVLSDLHIGHQASAVQNAAVIAPLLQPGRTVIFNGDTFEMRRKIDQKHVGRHVEEMQQLLKAHGATGLFINGNHDPVISELNHIECAESSVLITHGDVLFHNVAPWSLNEKHYRLAHLRELEQLSELEKTNLESRLAALRRATKNYDISHPVARPGALGTLVHFLETTWPPWRPLAILKSWAEVPGRARKFTTTYRPEVRTLIIGHSHFAGVWVNDGLRIINTGAAMTGFRPRAVRFTENRMTVQKLAWSGGQLHLAETVMSCAMPRTRELADT